MDFSFLWYNLFSVTNPGDMWLLLLSPGLRALMKIKRAGGKMSDLKAYDPKLSFEELGKTISKLGIKKANSKPWQLLLLGILAGVYISIGGHLFLVAVLEGAR